MSQMRWRSALGSLALLLAYQLELPQRQSGRAVHTDLEALFPGKGAFRPAGQGFYISTNI